MRDAIPARRIVCGVLELAVNDMRRPGTLRGRYNERIVARRSAVLWLGSTAATPWFDLAGLSQRRALRAMGWPGEAERILKHDRDLTPEQRALLKTGIRTLNGGGGER